MLFDYIYNQLQINIIKNKKIIFFYYDNNIDLYNKNTKFVLLLKNDTLECIKGTYYLNKTHEFDSNDFTEEINYSNLIFSIFKYKIYSIDEINDAIIKFHKYCPYHYYIDKIQNNTIDWIIEKEDYIIYGREYILLNNCCYNINKSYIPIYNEDYKYLFIYLFVELTGEFIY